MPAPLGAIVGYLRGKQQLKPSSSYQIDFRNLIMSLDNSSLNDLKREFILNNSQIDLAKFFWLMKQCITGDKCEGLFMYYELTRLFEEIDIDSSDTIDWN